MAKITYVEHDGTEHSIDVQNGYSVMEGAVGNMLPGIDAECGGACACATCMVYVSEEWLEKLSLPSETERAMLEYCPHPRSNSRLSCQIKVSDKLEGMRVVFPESQQ